MRPKSNQCHCQALEKVSLGRAMLLVRYNWILRGVSFILFALGSPVLPKIDFFLLNFLFCKISWKFQFSVKWLHPKAKFKKGDPLKIQFYLTDTISQPNDTFSRAWQWHWFDFGLIFTFLLANWWFAARFSSCSSSLNFEAKINFYTTKENCRKCRAKCTGLKLDLGPLSGSQKRLLFHRISWWPCIKDQGQNLQCVINVIKAANNHWLPHISFIIILMWPLHQKASSGCLPCYLFHWVFRIQSYSS